MIQPSWAVPLPGDWDVWDLEGHEPLPRSEQEPRAFTRLSLDRRQDGLWDWDLITGLEWSWHSRPVTPPSVHQWHREHQSRSSAMTYPSSASAWCRLEALGWRDHVCACSSPVSASQTCSASRLTEEPGERAGGSPAGSSEGRGPPARGPGCGEWARLSLRAEGPATGKVLCAFFVS